MVQKVQIKRTPTPNSPPTGLSPGELAIEMDTPTRLWVGVPTAQDATQRKLLYDSSAATGGGGLDQATADGLYVNIVGDTMTGALTLPGDPTVPLHASTKQYADLHLKLTGGTLTGPLIGTTAHFLDVITADSGMLVHGDPGNDPRADIISFGTLVAGDYPFSIMNGGTGINGAGLISAAANWTGLILWNDSTFEFMGGIGLAGKVGGGMWVDTSDSRIKDIQGEYVLGLNEVLQLRPVVYTFKGNDTATSELNRHIGQHGELETVSSAPYPASPHAWAAEIQQPYVGLIAQEVETIFPSMVANKSGYIDGVSVNDLKTLDSNELVYALVNAVKELSAQNAALSDRIAALEGAAP